MNAARLLLAPWWVVQLGTGAKSFADNPLIGSRALNARGLHAARVALADRMAAARRRRLDGLVPAADRAAFARDGFIERRDFLPPDRFRRLLDEVRGWRAPAREVVQGDTITRRIWLGRGARAAMPEVAALLRSSGWRGPIDYVGSFTGEPDAYLQTILSQRHDAPPDPQTKLHADTFHATVKAWLFLTDVAADEGPLSYVPGSHRLTPARLAWERDRSCRADELDRLSARGSLRIDEGELAALGLPAPRLFAVTANTLVVADTHGFHARGPSVRPSLRAEIWAFGRRNPFTPWTGFDPLCFPGLALSRVPLMWWSRDRLAGLIGQPWAAVGTKTAFDP